MSTTEQETQDVRAAQAAPDKENQARLDAILEEEVRRGFAVVEVPAAIQAALAEAKLAPIVKVRFTRLNPRRKAKVAEAVQKRYHADLQNPDILSNDQLLKFVAERGGWTSEQTLRLEELVGETDRLRRDLFREGFTDQNWRQQFEDAGAVFRRELDTAEPGEDEAQPGDFAAHKARVRAVFDRWVDYMPDHRDAYTALYAAEQGGGEGAVYSVDKDHAFLMENLPSALASDALQLLDEVRDQIIRYVKLRQLELELGALSERHARIFSESVESRRQQAEEMARVYYCTEVVTGPDGEETVVGPLAKSLDGLWDFPEEMIRWLILELSFFSNGLTTLDREFLQAWGFLPAARAPQPNSDETSSSATAAPAPSVASPVPPTSRGA